MVVGRIALTLALGLLCLCSVGCRSRWAMRDPDYAAKYPTHSDEPRQVIKQAIDARHLRGKEGRFTAGGSSINGDHTFIEGGVFYLDRPTTETQLAVSAAYNDVEPGLFFGLGAKRRWQLPARGTPFVGIGGKASVNGATIACAAWEIFTHDDDDDHHHHRGDEDEDHSCVDDVFRGIAEVAPEVGFHFWPGATRRWTVSAAYHITTDGRNQDYFTINLARSRLTLPEVTEYPERPFRERWQGQQDESSKPATYWWEEENPWEGELSRLPPVMPETR